MLIDSSKICLLVVDIQERLIDSIFNSKKIITYTSRAIDIFTSLGIPVIFTEQYPKGLGPTVKELNEKLFQIGLDSNEWFFCTELLVKAEWTGMHIKEISVHWTDDRNSRVELFKLITKYLCEIRRLQLHRRQMLE